MSPGAAVSWLPPTVSDIFPLDRLPNEILHMIFEQLTHGYRECDIASLRLVCKRFADIGNYYLLSEVNLFFKSSQFDLLRQISEHPTISKKINTLFYEADMIDDYGSLREWKKHICIPNSMQDISPASFQPPSLTASEREQRAFYRNLKKSRQGPKKLLRSAYEKYAGYVADQKSIRSQDYNVEILKNALMKMPNIKTIEISTECCIGNAPGCGMEKAFKDGLKMPYGDIRAEEGCSVGSLRALLLAAEASGLHFETLAAGTLDWRFFKESSKNTLEVLRKMQRSLHCVRTIRLYISTVSEADDDAALYGDLSHVMVPECAEYLSENPHLKNFITATPDLERLDLNFDCDDPYPPASLCDSVGTFKWHALRIAAFAYISADEDCLAQFYERHAGTLRKIRLDTMLLTSGSWASLLQRTRRALKLEQAVFCGRLRSVDPLESFYFGLPAGLNSGRRARMEVVVEKYLLSSGGSGEDPLLDLGALVNKYQYKFVSPTDEDDEYGFVDPESDEAIMDRF